MGRGATIKRTDTEAIQSKGPAESGEGRQLRKRVQKIYKSRLPQREDKDDHEESRRRGYTNRECRRVRRRATIKRADTEAI